jgi:hypothetical protein
VRLGGEPALLDEAIVVKQPEDRLGIPDVDR